MTAIDDNKSKRKARDTVIKSIDRTETDTVSDKATKEKKVKAVNVADDANDDSTKALKVKKAKTVTPTEKTDIDNEINDDNKTKKKPKKEEIVSLDDDDISLFFRMQEAQDAANDDSGVTITLDDKVKRLKSNDDKNDKKNDIKDGKKDGKKDDKKDDIKDDKVATPKKVAKVKDVIAKPSLSDIDDNWTAFLDDSVKQVDTKPIVKKASSVKRPTTVSLDGITMKEMLTHLVETKGFDELFALTDIKAFSAKPSLTSSLKVLRSPEMEWAKKKIEYLYIQSMKKKK
jgi:hypothetical protein